MVKYYTSVSEINELYCVRKHGDRLCKKYYLNYFIIKPNIRIIYFSEFVFYINLNSASTYKTVAKETGLSTLSMV